MKLASPHLLNGALGALLMCAVAAACGSDSQHKSVRGGGGAGAGGQGGVVQGGTGVKPEAGNGGEAVALGGVGGAPFVSAGEAGQPVVVVIGGAPAGGAAGAAGAAGAVDQLPPVNCDPITFIDANLEAEVRYQLDTTGPITSADVTNLTALDMRDVNRGVTQLGGIECLTELTDVYFGQGGQGSTISDLAPLRYLKKLVTVDLNRNPLQSLEPLGELPDLQQLNLSDAVNGLDLGPLATAPSLTDLSLNGTTLGDLSPLAAIKTLATLSLSQATLTAPASLGTLKNVKQLTLNGSISDATPLAALKQLQLLDVSDKPLTNLSKLSTLINLTSLRASGAQLTSSTGVGSMTKLTNLDLSYNNIVDITPLQTLTKLTDLNLAFNQIADISALQPLILLKNLSLNYDPFTVLTPLVNNAGIATGDFINLGGVTVSCTDVTTLRNRGADVFDISCP